MTDEALARAFRERFGAAPGMSRAPARVNLVGEHTDYNDGWVLPVAIGLETRVAFAAGKKAGLVVRSVAFPDEEVEIAPGAFAPRGHWSDYVAGTAWALERAGLPVPDASLLVASDVPVGGGLSSSAALTIAVAGALLALSGRDLPPRERAALGHHAESGFVGVRCGIMDPFVVTLARAGHAMLLDCRSRETAFVRFPEALEIVVANSGVRHSLAGGEYNRRRLDCERATQTLARIDPGVRSLRDVTPERLEGARSLLDDVAYRRARHVVGENERVLRFAAALGAGDLDDLGALLAASHASLRDDYEVSCAELDVLVDLAAGEREAVGARMTGGGFGGCTVNLVRAGAGDSFARRLAAGYRRETGRSLASWTVRPVGGAATGRDP